MVRILRSESIEEALRKCRLAWSPYPEVNFGWCIHHEVLCEPLLFPIETRVEIILTDKPESELICRFDNMRPMTDEFRMPAAIRNVGIAMRLAHRAWMINPVPSQTGLYDVYDRAQTAWYLLAKDQFRNALQHLHRNDVPDNTWNGRSIFPPEIADIVTQGSGVQM